MTSRQRFKKAITLSVLSENSNPIEMIVFDQPNGSLIEIKKDTCRQSLLVNESYPPSHYGMILR